TDRARVTPDPCGGSVDALSGDVAPEVVEFVVNGIPWDAFPGPKQPLTEGDVQRLALAVASALNEGVEYDELARIASEALPRASSSPVAYLVVAFTKRLAHWRGRLNVVRVIGQDHPDPAPADTSAPSPSPAPSPAPRMLPACDTCGAEEGDPLGTRSITIEGPNGALSATPCTECRPKTA